MTTTTQQLPSNPARRLADKILARTNNGQDLIVLLHDISKGGYDASKNDRITATNFLTDRGYGKCPKQAPAAGGHTSDPNPAPETDQRRGACPVTTSRIALRRPPQRTRVPQARHPDRRRPPRIPRPSAQRPPTTRQTRHSRESGNPESFDISDSPTPFQTPFDPSLYPRLHNRNHQRRRNPCRYPHGDSRSRRRRPDCDIPAPLPRRPNPRRPLHGHKPHRSKERCMPRLPSKVDYPHLFTRSP